MAYEHLGIPDKPFEDVSDPRFYYGAKAHERALATLGDAIQQGCDAVLLTGEEGSGKTLLCRKLAMQSKATAVPILGTCGPEAKSGLIDRLCGALNIDLPASADAEQRVEKLTEALTNEVSPERPVVLLVLDQIENLAEGELEDLVRLCQMNAGGRRLMLMVLSGRPEAVARLAHTRLAQLHRHLGSTCLLEPLKGEEIGPYIGHQLTTAGYDGPELFDRQAVSLIGRLSGGNPGTVNRLCRAALQAADDQRRCNIDAALIEGLDLATRLTQTVPLPASRSVQGTKASEAPAVGESTESSRRTQASVASNEQRARHIEERVERACARAESVAARLEEALTLGARLGVETDRHAGILDQTIQQAAVLRDELAGLANRSGGPEQSGPSAELAEQIETACKVVAQIHQVGEDVTDRIAAAQNSALGVAEEHRHAVVEVMQQLQGAQDKASQARNEAEQLERRVQTALAGAGDRANALEGLCQQADSVGQTLKMETGTAQGTCRQVASLTGALQQAQQRSAGGVADATSTTESLIAAVTHAQAAANGIQQQLSSQISEAEDKARHLSDGADHRLRTTIALGQETASQVDDQIEACRRQSSALQEEVEVAGHAADAVGQRVETAISLADQEGEKIESLRTAAVQAATGLQDAVASAQRQSTELQDRIETGEQLNVACERMEDLSQELASNRDRAEATAGHLDRLVADSQTAMDSVDHRLRTTIALEQETVSQANDKIEACREQLRALQEKVEVAGHATDAVVQRVDTVISLADQEGEKIESLRTAAVQAATGLQDAVASAQRQSTELQDRIETGEQLNVACERMEDLSQELASNRDRAETTADHLDRLVANGKSAVEALTGAENSVTALRQEIAAAQDACQRVAALNEGLNQNRHDADTVSVEVRSVTGDLRAMLANGQTAMDALDHRLRTTIALGEETASQVDHKIEACRRQSSTLQEEVEVAGHAADAVVQRVDTVISLADQEGEKIESLRAAAVQGATGLQDAVASAQRQSTELQDRIETGEQLNVACERMEDLSQELASNRDRAETTADHLDRLVANGKSAVEALAGAENSVTALRQEIAAAQDACQDVAALNEGLNQNRHDADAVSVEVRSATDDLRAMLADSRTAVDAVDHRLRTTISVGQETVSQVDDKIEACRRQSSALQEEVVVAGHAADRIDNLTETLQTEAARGEGVVQASRTVLESLTHAMAEGRCEARSIGQAVESVVAQADETIASAAAQAEQAIDRVKTETSKVVSDGELAAQAVGRRVETVIALADQESEKIETLRTAAADAASTLEDRIASALDRSADLNDKIQAALQAKQSSEQIDRQANDRVAQVESVIGQLEDISGQARAVADSLAESTPPAQTSLRALTDCLSQTGPAQERLDATIAQAGRAQDQCHQEVITAGKAGAALTDLAKHAASIAQQIEKAGDSARAGFARLGEQREAARATIERQQILRDKGLALLEQLGVSTGSAQDLVEKLVDHNLQANEADADLQQSIDRAAQSKFEIDGRIQAADNRKSALQASESTLAEFVDQAEGLQEQIQRIQARADAFEVRLNQMLDRPTQIAAEAKSQATELQGVCRAVRKIFAGLSEAALQAKQRTDQFHQASRTADSQARRLATETSQAAETLQRWVAEAVSVQSRLASSLEQAPGIAQTHPAGALRSLSQLADKGVQRSTPLLQGKDPAGVGGRMTGPVERQSLTLADKADALLANRSGQTNPTESRTPAEARSRTEEVARLLEDARRVAEIAG